MERRINIQNDLESRRRIAETLPEQYVEEKEVINAQSEEAPEYPVIEAVTEPEAPEKRKTEGQGGLLNVSRLNKPGWGLCCATRCRWCIICFAGCHPLFRCLSRSGSWLTPYAGLQKTLHITSRNSGVTWKSMHGTGSIANVANG